MATAAALAEGLPAAVAEFPFEYQDGFLWLQVTAPQSPRPLNFLLDSGASASVLNLRTVDRLKLQRGAPASVDTVGGKATGYWPTKFTASIGGLELPHDYLALNLDSVSRASSHPVDGLLGMDFFRARVVQIDYSRKVVRLLAGVPKSFAQSVLPLRFGASGILIPVRVNHSDAKWVRLDTGCASDFQWVTSTVRPTKPGLGPVVAVAPEAARETSATVELGTVVLQTVPTDFHRNEIFPGEAGLLGNEVLRRFDRVTIDGHGNRLILGKSNGK